MFYDYEFIDRKIHEIKFENWYIKFYIERSMIEFISVHELN